jgi:hypothetical protein
MSFELRVILGRSEVDQQGGRGQTEEEKKEGDMYLCVCLTSDTHPAF